MAGPRRIMAEELRETEVRAAGDGQEKAGGNSGLDAEIVKLQDKLRIVESLRAEVEHRMLGLRGLRHETARQHVGDTLPPGTDGPDISLRERYYVAERARDYFQACDTIVELERLYGDAPSPEQRKFLGRLKASPAYMLTVLDEASPKMVTQINANPGRLCYVVHNTLPFSSGGYAVRTQGIATAIRQAGWDVVVLSRPGYPLDEKPGLSAAEVAAADSLDGIPYVRTLTPLRADMTSRDYMLAAANEIEKRLREYRPSVVMAASNYLTAAPALIAARRAGLPFYYEVRGLWEITRASSEMEFAETPAFNVQKILEASIAGKADHVFTLSDALREELMLRGVSGENITLLPNSVDSDRFTPRQRDKSLAMHLGIPAGIPVIGYVGTFADHEGLDDLARACGILKQAGVEFRLLLVGGENRAGSQDPVAREVLGIAGTRQYSDWVVMPGRVPHQEVAPYYSLIDIAPFPRKPWPVCELVSPLKPLEALAMEKAVVASSVRALGEMIRDGETGLIFEKGSVESLADKLTALMLSADLRARLGKQGRRWACSERAWSITGRHFDDLASRSRVA